MGQQVEIEEQWFCWMGNLHKMFLLEGQMKFIRGIFKENCCNSLTRLCFMVQLSVTAIKKCVLGEWR